jgi:hypothetical protein
MWIETVLEKGFTPISPVKQHFREGSRGMTQSIPFVPEGSSMSGFPDFATQSMEDLLNAEELMQHQIGSSHGFDEGFPGFEELSGWDGFDIDNLE